MGHDPYKSLELQTFSFLVVIPSSTTKFRLQPFSLLKQMETKIDREKKTQIIVHQRQKGVQKTIDCHCFSVQFIQKMHY